MFKRNILIVIFTSWLILFLCIFVFILQKNMNFHEIDGASEIEVIRAKIDEIINV